MIWVVVGLCLEWWNRSQGTWNISVISEFIKSSMCWSSAWSFLSGGHDVLSTLGLPGLPQIWGPGCLQACGRAYKTETQSSRWQYLLFDKEISKLLFAAASPLWSPPLTSWSLILLLFGHRMDFFLLCVCPGSVLQCVGLFVLQHVWS